MNFQPQNMEALYAMLSSFFITASQLIGFVLLAFVLLRLILFIVEKFLNKINTDRLIAKLNDSGAFGKKELKVDLTNICLLFVKWVLILIFLIIGAEILHLEILSNGISHIIGLLPKLLSAAIIFIIGVYLANLVRSALRSMLHSLGNGISRIVATIIFYVIIVFVSVTALEELDINTAIITSNITLIFGSILITFALAFGLGSKDVIAKLLLSFYTKKSIAIGDRIEIDGEVGVVKSIDNIYMVVVSEKEKRIYPVKYVAETKIKILD